MSDRFKKLPFFYGWVIVGISFLNLAAGYGSRASFSVFLVSIQETYGWNRGDISAGFTLHMLVALVGLPLVGAVVDRFGPRVLIPTGITIMAAGISLLGGLTRIWHFYLYYGLIMAFGRISISMVPHTAIISNWFVRRRGAAMGVTGAGIGIGSILMTPLFQLSLSLFGWQKGCVIISGLIMLFLLPANILFQRLKPSDLGLLPDGNGEFAGTKLPPQDASKEKGVKDFEPASSWTARQAVATPRFWLMYLVFFFSATVFMIDMHQIAFYQDIGLNRNTAVSIFALVGLIQSSGVFCGGTLSDRIGRERALTIGVCLQITGILTLMWIRESFSWVKIPFFILCYGFGNGFRTSILPTVTADLFPGKRVGSVYGLLASAITISAAFGPWFAGYLHDVIGSYIPTFFIVMGCLSIGCILVWVVAPRKHATAMPEGS